MILKFNEDILKVCVKIESFWIPQFPALKKLSFLSFLSLVSYIKHIFHKAHSFIQVVFYYVT